MFGKDPERTLKLKFRGQSRSSTSWKVGGSSPTPPVCPKTFLGEILLLSAEYKRVNVGQKPLKAFPPKTYIKLFQCLSIKKCKRTGPFATFQIFHRKKHNDTKLKLILFIFFKDNFSLNLVMTTLNAVKMISQPPQK